ncbi:DUF4037 domain-containing protein [Aromatoleum toluclasticum]|uniref:DUF4037 domain-containing protein n=1 Tax=Aromatoleum toluclasticum TaxID=92003 RepID=UPI001D1951FF|nr:DUF4037 domain-containing protein [Aromatoleum toluclasticum]MCC4116663.1 DUF4037 domain-containing protein [Aromatoleum toluclasticum]
MNGLTLAERYFERYGGELLAGEFAAWRDRIAVGLAGDGSDCLGFDDEQSRDHDWGPGFCLWLNDEEYAAIGASLQQAYDRLPKFFDGFARSTTEWGEGRVGVLQTGAWYKQYVGHPDGPQTLFDWLRVPEKYLAACTSGRVFHDPLDDFSRRRRRLLAFYPEDVRLAKIAARCMSIGQAGQYNFTRALGRGEAFVAQYAETSFCNDLMSLVYLLNRRYAPYYKWRHRGLPELPRLGRIVHERIAAMTAASDADGKRAHIDALCAVTVAELQAEGLTGSDSPFLVDHGPLIHERIEDPAMRRLSVLIG